MQQLGLLTSKSHIWFVTSLGPKTPDTSYARGLEKLTVTLSPPPDLVLKGVVAHLFERHHMVPVFRHNATYLDA